METIKERILQFGTLSAEEQQELETYVNAHPEWKALLEDVKALEELCREARLLHHTDDEVLAYYVVAQHMQLGTSTALSEIFGEVEASLSTDPSLRTRYEALTARLEELMSALDPETQFEELTGFEISSLAHAPSESSKDGGEHSAERRAASPRSMKARVLSLPRAFRWAAAAVVLVAFLYGGLYVTSRLMQSDVERLALVDLSETEVEGYQLTMRGAEATPDSVSTDELYLQALQVLRDSRITTLGLFPRHDQQKLAQAEKLLQRVIEREGSRSFLQVEAYFFLGKVHLAQGKIEAARSNFQTVAICEGRRSPEAVEILTELQKRYPAHGQSYLG